MKTFSEREWYIYLWKLNRKMKSIRLHKELIDRILYEDSYEGSGPTRS